MGYRIAVDTGGTFTDVAIADESGGLITGKGISTPERPFRGMLEALEMATDNLPIGVDDLLRQSDLMVYGTTLATNAILQQRTAKTAFLVTEGFPDILVLREGGKTEPFDFTSPYPEPYIPRHLTFEIPERVDAEGRIVEPLDEEYARGLLGTITNRGVEAIAVCLMWSIANPVHEDQLGLLIEEELPRIPFTLSHRLNPIIREYRRGSSAAIDASLKPIMQDHLRDIQRQLRLAGFDGDLLAATSVGGVLPLEEFIERPIYSVKSGPAMAPVAGRTYATAESDLPDDLIVCDAGGTSFDISLVRGGRISSTKETWLGSRYSGHITGLSSVDVRSIGAGGGSIAWVDEGGLLRVGPQSAGADPGPACYGKGGNLPTVTDAALVLGYIDSERFLDGRMWLDVEAAKESLGRVAEELDESVERCAYAILTIVNEHMVLAIQEITVNQGLDPRECLLVAGGGAGGLNIVPIARALGCRDVLVPRAAGALSAVGIQCSDVITEFSASGYANTASFDYQEINQLLDKLDGSIADFSRRLRDRGLSGFRTDYLVDAHYAYQIWELEVPLKTQRFHGPEDVEELLSAFHEEHERLFAVKEPQQHVECISWKARLTAELDKPPVAAISESRAVSEPKANSTRPAFFHGLGLTDTPEFLGQMLLPGMHVPGPAIVVEPTTTLIIYPGSSATVTSSDSYLLNIDGERGI